MPDIEWLNKIVSHLAMQWENIRYR